MPVKRLAISYSRFSDPKQAKGDSEDRQDRDFRSFCQRHQLTPVKEVYLDRGRSGYHGDHHKKGRLGQLLDAAKDGRFEPGTVIVVEAWDRLGRMRPDRQTKLIAELLETGVQIGVCRLDDIFTEEDFGTHKWTTLAVFVQLAFQESKQKAERAAASWMMRRQYARESGALVTTRVPAWLEVVKGEVRLIPERAATVATIFKLAAEGYGHTRIVQALIAGDHQPFGEPIIRDGRQRPQFSGKWTRPYIAQILSDKRAVGEFRPRKEGQPEGDPITGYYPAAVSEEEWLRAQAGRAQRNPRTGKATRQGRHVNVFKGMLTHARDGEGFTLHNKGTAVAPQLVLVNATGEGGRGACYTFPYFLFECAILGLLREVPVDEVFPPARSDAPDRAAILRERLKEVRLQIGQVRADLQQRYSKTLSDIVIEHEAEEEALAQELQEELAKSTRPARREWERFPSLVDALEKATDPDAARLKIRTALRAALENVRVLLLRRGRTMLVAVQCWFRGGQEHRDYLLLYRAAANHCPTLGYAWSQPDVADLGETDLRKSAHVHRLEVTLKARDLEALIESGTGRALALRDGRWRFLERGACA